MDKPSQVLAQEEGLPEGVPELFRALADYSLTSPPSLPSSSSLSPTTLPPDPATVNAPHASLKNPRYHPPHPPPAAPAMSMLTANLAAGFRAWAVLRPKAEVREI